MSISFIIAIMRQRRYLQNLVNSTHSSMRIEYKMTSWQKWMWCERWRGSAFRKRQGHKQIYCNSLFHSIWFHIPWWRRWVGGAPARRAGCCAAGPSPWWPRWPGTELFRQEHVNKQRANPTRTHTHTAATNQLPLTLSGPREPPNIHRDAS